MQTHLGTDSIFDDESLFLPGEGGGGKPPAQREVCALLSGRWERAGNS